MRNAGLDEAQAGIKIAGRNINNLRYADDNTLVAESEKELKQTVSTDQNRSYIRCESLTLSLFRVRTATSLTTLKPLCGSQQTVENS